MKAQNGDPEPFLNAEGDRCCSFQHIDFDEELEVAFQMSHTLGRVRWLRTLAMIICIAGLSRLARVAMGVETAAGAYDNVQIGIFVAYVVLGVVLLAFTGIYSESHDHANVHRACIGMQAFCAVMVVTLYASLASQDEAQPKEVWIFIGATMIGMPIMAQALLTPDTQLDCA